MPTRSFPFAKFLAVALMLALAASGIPFGSAARAQAPASAPSAALCDGKTDGKADKDQAELWGREMQAKNPQHQALNLLSPSVSFVNEAGNTVQAVCAAKRKSDAQIKAVLAAPKLETAGDACKAFQEQENVYIAAADSVGEYAHALKTSWEGGELNGNRRAGLLNRYAEGSQKDYAQVNERGDSAKEVLEKEFAASWGARVNKGNIAPSGYFSSIMRQVSAENKKAADTKAQIAGSVAELHKKFPNCPPSDKAKAVVAGASSAGGTGGRTTASGRDGMATGAARSGGEVSGPEKAPDGKAVDTARPPASGPEADGGDKGKTPAAAGGEESFLSENGGYIAGGLAVVGAAGAAAYVLTNKKAQASIGGFWDNLVGNKEYAGQGDPAVPRPEKIAVSEKFVFSAGLPVKAAAQAASEARWIMSDAEHDARYRRMQEMGIGYRFYNYFWSGLEASGQASSATPAACPAGHTQYPKDEAERAALGYKRFHCYKDDTVSLFDNLLRRDQAAGFQSGVIMWSSPAVYRHPDCSGMSWAGGTMKDGCVPRDDAMDDFSDYANFLASRYNGGANGKISHFVVWNENGSEEWFDYSPTVAKGSPTGAGVEKRIEKYVAMLKLVHAVLVKHQKQALMYVSTDQLLEPGMQTGHMGTRVLLDGIWARLGTDYSWSLAVHPYGNVYDRPKANVYTFANLENMFEYQKAKLAERGVTDPMTHPQAYLSATEQGWGVEKGGKRENQARNICLAHDRVSRMPWLLTTAHNYFHSTEANETSNDTSSQGHFFGMIPHAVPNDLSGVEATPTGAALYSTGPALWGKNNVHYCCKKWEVGCQKPR